jgi:hypothetical protein
LDPIARSGERVKEMNTKKDFQSAASIVRDYAKEYDKSDRMIARVVSDAFVQFFREQNPRFDVERFRAACGVSRIARG